MSPSECNTGKEASGNRCGAQEDAGASAEVVHCRRLLVKRTDGSRVDESRAWVVFLHSASLISGVTHLSLSNPHHGGKLPSLLLVLV